MEHKSWLWKKKSTEKTMITTDKVNRGNEDELQANLTDKVDLQRDLKISDEKLLAAFAEINAKDDIAKKQTNIAREAIQGWEKAEMEVLALKQELEKATQQQVADEERLHDADASLNECMMQLRIVREKQVELIHDAATKTSSEHEKIGMNLEEKLAESNKKLVKLGLENTQLSKSLSEKEKMIDELHSIRGQMDYDLSAVMNRLESTQRENASLIYEIRVLEKELEIRNEEREFNRRQSDVAHKQYLGCVKKIAKLETEAQRLRLLVQKRLPGPADVAKMKNAVEVTRRRSNPFPIASNDFTVDNDSSKKIAFLAEQLSAFEAENKLLKEFLNQKTSELTLSKSQTPMAASSSDMGSDEKVSMVESWAPSCNTVGASDIGLMDDFIEMEKLALVSVDKPFANSSLVKDNHSHWLENILKVVAEHAKIMQKSSSDMLDDIKVALAGKNNYNRCVSEEMLHSGMNKSIQRLIEVIEGIKLCDTPTRYTVHIFQWKTSELRAILEVFIQSCNKLVNGKIGVEDFVKELTCALEWIVNHCFSLQDVSSMKDEIKKHFEWEETRSESEVEGGTIGQTNKLTFPIDRLPGWPMGNRTFHLEAIQPNVREEVRKPIDDIENLESAKKDLIIQTEVDIMVKAADKPPINTIDECNEAHHETTSIKEQESNTSSNEQLNTTNLQPESMTENEVKNGDLDHDERTVSIPSQAQEITVASEKLAECQETILNLGKQLKAMGSDKCEITVSPLPNDNINNDQQRISLLDKMITEDATGAPRSPKTKGVTRALTSPAKLDGNLKPVNVVMSPRMFVSVDGVRDEKEEEALVNFLSIVPNKKKSSGGGILTRLFRRKKKGNNKN